jgi:hypothetical protein
MESDWDKKRIFCFGGRTDQEYKKDNLKNKSNEKNTPDKIKVVSGSGRR